MLFFGGTLQDVLRTLKNQNAQKNVNQEPWILCQMLILPLVSSHFFFGRPPLGVSVWNRSGKVLVWSVSWQNSVIAVVIYQLIRMSLVIFLYTACVMNFSPIQMAFLPIWDEWALIFFYLCIASVIFFDISFVKFYLQLNSFMNLKKILLYFRLFLWNFFNGIYMLLYSTWVQVFMDLF